MGYPFDQEQLNIKLIVLPQPLYGFQDIPGALHATMGRSVQERQPLSLGLLCKCRPPCTQIDVGIRQKLSLYRQNVQQIGIERVDAVSIGSKLLNSPALTGVRRQGIVARLYFEHRADRKMCLTEIALPSIIPLVSNDNPFPGPLQQGEIPHLQKPGIGPIHPVPPPWIRQASLPLRRHILWHECLTKVEMDNIVVS